ncbi:hypothetical protein RhiirA4_470966 [Rhizophagus irregularis]|uniref:Uncharacterized protein n=1 Tax=Rhizophagus irregularis TaxID=588596 RepID=A0A2I1H286_9GLOM|nr:hypothetical protein RhiirA4_470966 [Rhizophagus irregularis]
MSKPDDHSVFTDWQRIRIQEIGLLYATGYDELNMLKTILISCQCLEIIQILYGESYLLDKEVLETILNIVPYYNYNDLGYKIMKIIKKKYERLEIKKKN